MIYLFRLIAISVVLCAYVGADRGPFVQIKNGVLRGTYMETKNGRKFEGYMGIPYAKPPIGDLRFKEPVAATYWSGVKDATKVHGLCPQRNIYTRTDVIEGDEDCLFLNVYTPRMDAESPEVYPVMIFLHGGGWLCGSGNSMWYGPEILLDRDVVLVVPNYRLGALGFLTTGDEVVPGNNGLKDQVMVLKWIQENISKFGGDPKSVTIFGESAGGASAHYHMLSPLSRGLFSNAISESGTALCPWAFSPKNEGLINSKKLAKLFKCPTDSTKKMVECLRKVDARDIIAKDSDFMLWDKDPMIPFKPVIEPEHKGALITKHPIELIKSGDVANVSWMVGLNSDDGALRVAALYGIPKLIEELNEDFENKLPISLIFDKTSENPSTVAKDIKQYYFQDKELNTDTKQAVVDLYTDGWFLNGADQAVALHKKYLKHPIYYYLFGYRGVASFSEVFGDKHNNYGVCHADELQYLFPVADGLFPDKTHTESDKKVAKLMTTLWVNFAKDSDPTPKMDDVCHKKWLPVESAESMEYLNIGAHDDIGMESGLYMERAKFWRNLPINAEFSSDVVRDEL
ncbi:PREDICTED: venom carboxylesterase-6-like [Nicrophorus vespilloides]|uniref:Carboxylic ester hydrolase n=1 Tax=Nicrophorus vespilloides TaxID=110193 RepID=A0ABM1NF46_NICVS|nr:PREDICTED: venom carboxylesterase-6-like [Nicrophorus vespilloides]